MPPRPQYPSAPSGSNMFVPGYGEGYGYGSGAYTGQYRPAGASSSNPAGQGADYVTPEQWDQYLATLRQAYQASSGFERTKLKAQMDDAEKGRQNALKIAQLQADNSRYGVDQQRLTAIEQLKQRDKEFAANHELDAAKLTGVYQGQRTLDAKRMDLDEAQLIAQQRSQPNRLFQTMDLEQALGSIRNGGRATTAPMTGVAAIDRLSSDYTGNPYLAGGGSGPIDGRVTYASSSPLTGQTAGSNVGTNTSSTVAPDPRIKALRAVMEALPPSAAEGLDPTGVSALNAAYALYSAPSSIRPGTLESLSPTQQATAQSAAARLQGVTGRSWDDITNEYDRNKPRQGGVRSAA